MFISETALALSVICTDPRKKTSEQELYYIDDGNPCRNSFQIFSGTSMERMLASNFQDINGVSAVHVRKNGWQFSIEIDLSLFDRPTRNKVFEKELEMYVEFPNTSFEFCVVDASSKGAEDAHTA